MNHCKRSWLAHLPFKDANTGLHRTDKIFKILKVNKASTHRDKALRVKQALHISLCFL